MGNCLITKLAGSVTNPNLDGLGVLKLHTMSLENPGRINQRLITRNNEAYTISVDGDGYFAETYEGLSDPSARKTTKEIGPFAGSQTLYFKNDTYNVYITNKYKLNLLDLNKTAPVGSIFTINLEILKYCTSLSYAYFGDNRIFGDIKSLSDNPLDTLTFITCVNIQGNADLLPGTIKSLTLRNCPFLTGSLSNFGKFQTINLLNLGNTTNIVGSLEDFVTAQVTGGRQQVLSNNPISFQYLLQEHEFGGEVHPSAFNYNYVTWESSTKIAVYSGSKTGMDNTTVVHCKGYTQEEAEAAFSGYTIIRVDA